MIIKKNIEKYNDIMLYMALAGLSLTKKSFLLLVLSK